MVIHINCRYTKTLHYITMTIIVNIYSNWTYHMRYTFNNNLIWNRFYSIQNGNFFFSLYIMRVLIIHFPWQTIFIVDRLLCGFFYSLYITNSTCYTFIITLFYLYWYKKMLLFWIFMHNIVWYGKRNKKCIYIKPRWFLIW